jgi:hypothetical protein
LKSIPLSIDDKKLNELKERRKEMEEEEEEDGDGECLSFYCFNGERQTERVSVTRC